MDLQHVLDLSLVDVRRTTGVVLTFPRNMQHLISSAVIEHFAADFDAAAESSLRSKEDLTYVLECIAPVFSFSAKDFTTTILKALSIYSKLMCSSFTIVPSLTLSDAETNDFLCSMVRQLSLLFAVRDDYPAGSDAHIKLLACLIDQLAEFFTQVEGKIQLQSWHLMLRVMFGVLNFCTSVPRTFPEVRASMSSLALECLIRTKTQSDEMWALLHPLVELVPCIASQWAIAIAGLARALSAPSSGNPMPKRIVLRWASLLDRIRPETDLVDYTLNEVSFMWKKLLRLLGPLARIEDDDALQYAICGLRDAAVLLSNSSFWCDRTKHDMFDMKTKHPPLRWKFSPPNPTTDDLAKFCAVSLYHPLLRKETNELTPSFQKARCNAIEGLCAVFLRRESEHACRAESLDAFLSMIVLASDDESPIVRGSLLHQTQSIYMLDIPIPLHVMEALGRIASSLLCIAPADLAGEWNEEEEDESADERESPMFAARNAAVQHLCCLFPVALQFKHEGLAKMILHAYLRSLECFSTDPTHVQRVLSCLLLCIWQFPSVVAENSPTALIVEEIIGNVISLLRARFGTYAFGSLIAAVMFLAGLPSGLNVKQSRAIVVALAVFAASLRMHETDEKFEPNGLFKLFHLCIMHLCEMICRQPSVLDDDETMAQLIRCVEVGLKPVVVADAFEIRDSALLLIHVVSNARAWPHIVDSSADTTCITEGDYAGKAKAVRCFALNGDRVMTLLYCQSEDTEADGELVVIIRDHFGRWCWKWKRSFPESHYIPPTMKESAPLEFQDFCKEFFKGNVLGAASDDTRTKNLIERWGQDPSVAGTVTSIEETEASAPPPSEKPPDARATCVFDGFQRLRKLMRLLISDFGLVSTRTRELQFNAQLVRILKGIDCISSRECLSVRAVRLLDECNDTANAAGACAFDAFIDALSWHEAPTRNPGAAAASDERLFADLVLEIKFDVCTVAAKQFEHEELAAETDEQRCDVDRIEVRIIWDESSCKYEWASMQSPQSDHFSTLSPQWHRSSQTRFFDIVVAPLPRVGSYSVRLMLPSFVRNTVRFGADDPVKWGAPLLHGCIISANSLAPLVRLALWHAVCSRRLESDFRSPILARRLALRSAIGEFPSEPLATQTVVSMFA